MADLVTAEPVRGESLAEVGIYEFLRLLWDLARPAWVNPGWWSMPVRPEALQMMSAPPGPQLLEQLHRLDGLACPAEHEDAGIPDVPRIGTAAGFPCGCQVVVVAAWQAVAAWVAVQASGALVDAVCARPVVVPGRDSRPRITDPGREEVAMALRITPASAAALIGRARELHAQPGVADLAAEGALPLRTVQRVCGEVVGLDPEDAAAVAHRWVGLVRGRCSSRRGPMSSKAAATAARRLIIGMPSHSKRRAKARAERRVEVWQQGDGTATLAALLPEEAAHRIHRRLTLMAEGLDDPDDTRGMDAKRGDLLIDILLGRADPQVGGVEVNVTIPVDALLGLREGSANIAGLGPVPVEVARELAADGRWRAWLTGIDGTVIATSSTTYRPGGRLARLVRAREPECRMPGCTRSAQRCDLDHAVPWPDGPTDAANLGPLCRRHHVMKTQSGSSPDPAGSGVAHPSGGGGVVRGVMSDACVWLVRGAATPLQHTVDGGAMHAQQPDTSTPPAGWYPDPQGQGLRTWDGAAWSSAVHPSLSGTSSQASRD